MKFATPSSLLRFSSALAFSTAVLTLLACSSSSDTGGQGGSPAAGGSSAQGGSSASGGATTNGGSTPSNGGSSSGGSTSGGVSSGGSPSGGSSSGGSSNGGATSGGSANGGASNSGGSANGGSASGGASQGGGSSGGAAAQGGGNAQGGASAQGGSSSSGCPGKATFCSGFEDNELPAQAIFKLNGDPATKWTASFEVDTAIKHAGQSSLRVKAASEGGGGGAYKMLAVPSGGSKFWVRMYMRSDKDLGDVKHNVFAQASASDSPNDNPHMEFGEDVGMCWHFDDSNIRWPMDYGRINGATKPYTLAKDTWHCVELFFDGEAHVHRAFVNGTELINATSFPSMTVPYAFFKFGYNSVNGTERKTWYDDVAVGPERIPCQ